MTNLAEIDETLDPAPWTWDEEEACAYAPFTTGYDNDVVIALDASIDEDGGKAKRMRALMELRNALPAIIAQLDLLHEICGAAYALSTKKTAFAAPEEIEARRKALDEVLQRYDDVARIHQMELTVKR